MLVFRECCTTPEPEAVLVSFDFYSFLPFDALVGLLDFFPLVLLPAVFDVKSALSANNDEF